MSTLFWELQMLSVWVSSIKTLSCIGVGATLDNVEQCISLATSKIKLPNTHIGKVILCLGINDVTRNRDDSDQINITATQAIYKIKQTFSKSQITVCSILPPKGRGQHLIKMNDTSNYVNRFLKIMCIRDGTLDFIDIHKEFSKQGTVIKPLFDPDTSVALVKKNYAGYFPNT